MLTTHPADTLLVAHRRGLELRAEAAAHRQLPPSPRRHALAEALRRAADRLDRAPLAHRPAGQW